MEHSQEASKALFAELEKMRGFFLNKLETARANCKEWIEIQETAKKYVEQVRPKIRINVGGKIFQTSKATLLRFPTTVFSVMLGTPHWRPKDDIFFFDRPSHAMDHVLDYLSNGNLRTESFSPADLKSLLDDVNYFHIPYQHDRSEKGASTSFFPKSSSTIL